MNPVIINMKDMSDSTEVYESKPNRFLVYTIYVILAILVIAFIWMYFSKMDIVVKSDGIFRGNQSVYEVSSGVSGKLKECNVEDGQYVEKGDKLFELSVDSLSDTITNYQKELEEVNNRLEMIDAYAKSLDGDMTVMDALSDNPFYQEFVNRRRLLSTSIDSGENDTSGQIKAYQDNVNAISDTIQKYREKADKLNQVKACIANRSNTFGAEDTYYCSLVNSYIASYNYTALQYDNQMTDYRDQDDKIQAVSNEKSQALANLELQQMSTIEQQISSLEDTIASMQTNLTTAQSQLELANTSNSANKHDIQILTEKGTIATEKLSYQDKKSECENYLNGYDIQNNNCVMKASTSGYFYSANEWKEGSYLQEGTSVGSIYPEQETAYSAELYVENSDIAKLREGQEVKFEIAAYPSSEYGYFSGEVSSIAKDITVNQNTGKAYYLVKVECEQMTLEKQNGETATLMNGMACQGKVVVDQERVLQYLLEKIDLLGK